MTTSVSSPRIEPGGARLVSRFTGLDHVSGRRERGVGRVGPALGGQAGQTGQDEQQGPPTYAHAA